MLNVTAAIGTSEMLMYAKCNSGNRKGRWVCTLKVTAAVIREEMLTHAKVNSRNHEEKDAYVS